VNPIWGVGLGLCAALSFSVGLLLQKRAASELPAVGRSALRSFLRSPRWLGGNALVALGWVFQLAGLAIAPVAVVMPTVATGLIFQAVLAHVWLRERWTGFELSGVLTCVIGLVLLSLSIDARLEHAGRDWSGPALASVLAAVALLALICVVSARRVPAMRAACFAAASGLLYAGTGLLTKVLGIVVVGAWDAQTVVLVVALLLGFGAAALVLAQSAYQSGRAVVVLPMMCGLADFLPTALSPLVFDEKWPADLAGVLRTAAVGAILLGVLLLGGPSAKLHEAVDAPSGA
jgi:drug/metabolite transporter (DMT)-like permease